MLGVRVQRMRIAILGFSTLTVASIISVTGLISFVGLIAPHIARLLARRSTFAVSVLAGLIGSVILLISDSLARVLTSAELPISILTTLIGVPFLILFMIKRREGRKI
jgi:iron complex transport system permease protein